MLRPTVVKTRGWIGVLLGEPEPSLCLFPLRVYCFAQLYTRLSMEGAPCQGKKGLLSGARVRSKLAPLLLCGDIWGFRQECSVTLSRLLGAPVTQSWTFTSCSLLWGTVYGFQADLCSIMSQWPK